MATRHIVSAFDEDLRAISGRISEMGGLAEEQLGQAIEALQNRDSELAEAIIRSDKRLDAMEMDLEQEAVQVIALRQPMAGDLREIIAALKISSALERIGDLAKNVAKRTLVLNQSPPLRVVSSITRMGRQTQGLMAEALDAYTARDTVRSLSVWKRDVEIDEMHILINRPVVETSIGTRLCRPSKAVLDILPNPQLGHFRKEDGELVVDAEGRRVNESAAR